MNACLDCLAGKYQTTVGATASSNCTDCNHGTWSDVTAATSSAQCENCGIGRYNPNTGTSTESRCLGCPPGSWGEVLGATNEIQVGLVEQHERALTCCELSNSQPDSASSARLGRSRANRRSRTRVSASFAEKDGMA